MECVCKYHRSKTKMKKKTLERKKLFDFFFGMFVFAACPDDIRDKIEEIGSDFCKKKLIR